MYEIQIARVSNQIHCNYIVALFGIQLVSYLT